MVVETSMQSRAKGLWLLVFDATTKTGLPMPNRTTELLNFGRLGRRHLQANFDGGDLSSDGGLMLLRQIDARTGLSRMAAGALTDPRAAVPVPHRLRDCSARRPYGLWLGSKELNEH